MSHLQLVLQFNLVLCRDDCEKLGTSSYSWRVFCCCRRVGNGMKRNENLLWLRVNGFPRKTRSTKWKYWVRTMRFELRWFNITDRWLRTDCHDSWPKRVVFRKFEVRDIVIGLAFIKHGWCHDSSTKAAANFIAKCAANGQGWRIWFLLQSRFIGIALIKKCFIAAFISKPPPTTKVPSTSEILILFSVCTKAPWSEWQRIINFSSRRCNDSSPLFSRLWEPRKAWIFRQFFISSDKRIFPVEAFLTCERPDEAIFNYFWVLHRAGGAIFHVPLLP